MPPFPNYCRFFPVQIVMERWGFILFIGSLKVTKIEIGDDCIYWQYNNKRITRMCLKEHKY